MLDNIKIELIKLDEKPYLCKYLITLKSVSNQVSFVKIYSDEKPDVVEIINDLITDGCYVKEGYDSFHSKFSAFLSSKELEDYYEDCILINNKLILLFGNYVDKWS